MNGKTEIEINKTLIDEAERIKKNECRWEDGNPFVNVKDFEIKFTQLSWIKASHLISFSEGDIANDSDKKKMVEWMMRDSKSVKILPLIITSNIFILVVLAVISKMLSSLIEKGIEYIDKIEIDFLVGKEIIKYSEFIKDPFDENYRRIIPDFYENNLPTVIEINVSELKSLLNILILSLEIKGVDLRKIINRVNHTDIKNYCRENVEYDERIERTIGDWTSKRRVLSENDKVGKRVQEVALNEKYNITAYLLKIAMSVLQATDNKSRDKFILIVATPVKEAIKLFFTENTQKMEELELDNERLDDIMFVSYTDPADPKDPEVIVQSIPSYLTILSKYINSQEIVYAIDEYFHSKMMDTVKSRKFRCEKFHVDIGEEIMKELIADAEKDDATVNIKGSYIDIKEQYIKNKSVALKNLSDCIKELEKSVSETEKVSATTNVSEYVLRRMWDDVREKRGNLQKALDEIEINYIKKQKKELEVINDGFLTVQNDILEQLKLIL